MQIRRLSDQDIDRVIGHLQAMIVEMASFGGHPVRDQNQSAKWFRDLLSLHLESPDHLFLIAEDGSNSKQIIGILGANIAGSHPLFLPRSSLHVHSIYVVQTHRRSGVARRLINAALEWGRERGCDEADLNVLKHSPAASLYRGMGFEVFQIEMRRKL
jgi:ribosomal protein S18 acetylase RimI-like enzyme